MLIFPFRVDMLLKGALLFNNTYDKKRQSLRFHKQHYVKISGVNPPANCAQYVTAVHTVSIQTEFQACQSGDNLLFSLCVIEVKASVSILLHAVAYKPVQKEAQMN